MNTKHLIEQARMMAKQEPINGALWNAMADKLEEATTKSINTLTVKIDVDFLGKTAPELVNEIKAQAVREAKMFLLSNGFNHGAPYKLDELINELEATK